jgi:hypothetical protein
MNICKGAGTRGNKWETDYSTILTKKGKTHRWISCFYPDNIEEENDVE